MKEFGIYHVHHAADEDMVARSKTGTVLGNKDKKKSMRLPAHRMDNGSKKS